MINGPIPDDDDNESITSGPCTMDEYASTIDNEYLLGIDDDDDDEEELGNRCYLGLFNVYL